MPKANGDSLVILCPYCGNAQAGGSRCDVCGGLFEPLSRKATQISMGPWSIRDVRNPFRPGCSYEVIKKQAKAGRIKATTVMRGPTTRQFWSVARNVPGVAHLIGYCHACSEKVGPGTSTCPHCGVVFAEPNERNELGLMYPSEAEAQKAQRHLNAAIAREAGAGEAGGVSGGEAGGDAQAAGAASRAGRRAGAAAAAAAPGADLLDEVFGGDAGDEAGQAAGAGESRTPSRSPAPAPADGGSRAAEPSEPVYADLDAFVPLDFTPSDESDFPEQDVIDPMRGHPAAVGSESDDETLDELASKNNRLGMMTWVLIGVNVAILLLVAILFFQLMLKPPARTDRAPNNADARLDQRPQDEVVPFRYEPPRLQPVDDATPDPAPADATAPPDAAEQAQRLAEAAQRERDRLMHNEVAGIVNRAESMRSTGNLEGAVILLEGIRKNYSPAFHPPHLNTWISNVKKAIDGDKNPTFFGVEGK